MTEVMTSGATGVLIFETTGDVDAAGLNANPDGVLVSDPMGPVGPTGPPTDWQDSSTQNWSGAVSLANLLKPQTIRATLTGNVTGVTLPTWAADKSGAITLVLIQDGTGNRTWVQPGLSMAGIKVALSTAANARDIVVMFWSGANWTCIPSAMNVS